MPGAGYSSIQSITDAVARFTASVNVSGLDPHANVSALGQFFWKQTLDRPIQDSLRYIGRFSAASEFYRDAQSLIAYVGNADSARTGAPEVQRRLTALSRFIDGSKMDEALKKVCRQLVAPTGTSGRAMDALLWARLNATLANTLPPFASREINLRVLWNLKAYELTACWTYAATIARRYYLRAGRPAGRSTPFRKSLVGGPPWGVSDRTEHDGKQMGDVVRQKGVGPVVQKMMKELDAGRLLHARVLSGKGYGTSRTKKLSLGPGGVIKDPSPPEEHSLVIIGHDGRGTFVFHDPDASKSHAPTPGFGLLFYDEGRDALSTAASANDVAVDSEGKHDRGRGIQREKRYQVLNVSTFA
jgi:hypothetical protein